MNKLTGLTTNLVPIQVRINGLRLPLLSPIVIILAIGALGIQQIHGEEVPGPRAPPIDHSKRVVRRDMTDRTPDIDQLEAVLKQLLGLLGRQMPPDARCGGRGRLVDVDLLHGAAGRVRVAPADSVVEDDDLADFVVGAVLARADVARERVAIGAQHGLDVGVVGPAHRGVVDEGLLRRWPVLQPEPGDIRVELGRGLVAQVMHRPLHLAVLVRHAAPVDLRPVLGRVDEGRQYVDVVEHRCSSHTCLIYCSFTLSFSCLNQPVRFVKLVGCDVVVADYDD